MPLHPSASTVSRPVSRTARLTAGMTAVLLFVAGCETGFLDPNLAGVWGGTNLEVKIEADHVTAKLQCDAVVVFPGAVRLGELQDFQRDGILRMRRSSMRLRLAAWLAHPDTMMAMVYDPNNPLIDPAPPIPLVRGQAGDFESTLILCTG